MKKEIASRQEGWFTDGELSIKEEKYRGKCCICEQLKDDVKKRFNISEPCCSDCEFNFLERDK